MPIFVLLVIFSVVAGCATSSELPEGVAHQQNARKSVATGQELKRALTSRMLATVCYREGATYYWIAPAYFAGASQDELITRYVRDEFSMAPRHRAVIEEAYRNPPKTEADLMGRHFTLCLEEDGFSLPSGDRTRLNACYARDYTSRHLIRAKAAGISLSQVKVAMRSHYQGRPQEYLVDLAEKIYQADEEAAEFVLRDKFFDCVGIN